ncbi:hypothetical protein Ancab_003025 [Ancistrocladus abbreviatus]
MLVLNQLFNRGLLRAKCKTCLNLAISRIKLLQNRRDVQLKQMRKEIAQFLQTGQEAIARIRVEHVIREQNIWAAYETLEMFCEFVLARVPILESQRDCPPELQEAIEYVSAISELRPDTSVNRTIIENLSVSTPSPEVKLKLLKEIAQEYGLAWDSSETEIEFNKKHEDLLDGSKRINGGVVLSKAPNLQQPSNSSLHKEAQPVMPRNGKASLQSHQSTSPKSIKSFSDSDGIESSVKSSNGGSMMENHKETRPQSSDVLERARAAMASAERASAAAPAAAQLVNAKFGPLKLEEGKS